MNVTYMANLLAENKNLKREIQQLRAELAKYRANPANVPSKERTPTREQINKQFYSIDTDHCE